jgi:ABC-type lipoprotein export system ATPase subunit
MALLQELNQDGDLTLLVVTHDPEAAAFADRAITRRGGRVEA